MMIADLFSDVVADEIAPHIVQALAPSRM